jgi:hypothetical protein
MLLGLAGLSKSVNSAAYRGRNAKLKLSDDTVPLAARVHAGGQRGGGAPGGDGSLIGTRYRWTTSEMQARVMAAIEQRLAVSFAVAARIKDDR